MKQKTVGMSCEDFYFTRIASAEGAADDYREFFELLWQANGEFVFKLACAHLGNHEDARDVCQDAFVRAMTFLQKNPGRIPLKVNFHAWLRAITRHLIYDRFRRPLLARPGGGEVEALAAEAPAEQSPEERTIHAEDLARLRQCIQLLQERARTLVLLRDVEGLGEKDIAARLNTTSNNVCVGLHRARKTLRECVGAGGDK